MSLLRRLLGADRINHQAGGYALRVEPGELDALEFESDLASGHEALQTGDPYAAGEYLARALARWRGPALVDVSGAAWARAVVTRLEEQRLTAEESLLGARMALGRHRESVAAAQSAVDAAPLREQRWATLMLALYRSGRQADALRTFQRLRRFLDEELGLEPSTALRELEESIVLHRRELDWVATATLTGTGAPAPVVNPAAVAVSGDREPPTVSPSPGREALAELPTELPMPEVLRHPVAEYVGRTAEQDQLARAFDRAVAGERQIAVVGGEPGIGKTALTAVVARAVEEVGGSVLYGRCLDPGAPYQPFVDALGHYVRFAPRHELEAHVAAHGGELSRLVPMLARRVPEVPPPSSSDPDTERSLAFTAAAALLNEACRHRPLLLVLDDLHWADASTLALLRHLVSASASSSLLVVGTFRSSEVDGDHPLSDTLAALWREPGVSRLELTGLTPDDVLDLCVTMAGHPVEDVASLGFVSELQRDTGGNPFFVREVLRHLVESGSLVQDDAERWSADPSLVQTGLPSSLREVIAERVRHLSPDAPTLLSLAAVIGVEFELSLLVHATGWEEDRLLRLLEQGEQSALLVEQESGGTFLFAHALTRHTLYDGLGPTRRRRLHGQVAAALEQGVAGSPSSARLAFHFTEAGETGPALRYAELAGHDALRAMAAADAVRWFGEARALLDIEKPDDALRRCDLAVQLGTAQLLAGDPEHRRTLLEAGVTAEAAGDPRRMAVAALANSRGYYSAAGQTDQERVAALRRAVVALGTSDAQLRVRLLATLCSETVFELPLAERRAEAERAVEEARAVGDPVTLLAVLNLVFEPIRHPTALDQRLDHSGQAILLAGQVRDPAATFWAVAHRMQTLIEAALVPEAEELFERLVTIAGDVGQPAMRWMAVFAGAQWALLRGDTARGELLAEEAFQIGTDLGQPDAFNYFATQISHIRWQQGRLGELVDLIDQGARDNPGIPAYKGALARALCQAGRQGEAVHLLDRATRSAFADLPEDLLWAYGLSTFAEAAMQLDHTESAALLYARLRPFEGQLTFVGTICEGPIAHYLGGLATVLGRFDQADDHLATAAKLAARAGSPFYEARTLIEQGRLALRRGDGDRSRRLLTEGRDMAGRWGFAGEERRAAQALLDVG